MSEDLALNITSTADLQAIQRLLEALQTIQDRGGDLVGALNDTSTAAAGAEENLAGVAENLTTINGQGVPQSLVDTIRDAAGASGDLAGGMGEVKTEAGEAAEGLGQVETKADKATRGISRMMVAQTIVTGIKKVVEELKESIGRLAEQGDKDALRLQESLGRTQTNLERTQDNLAKKVIPVLGDAAGAFNTLFENVSSVDQVLAILDPTKSTQELQNMGNAAAESARQFGDLGRAVMEKLGATTPITAMAEAAALAVPTFGDYARSISTAGYRAGDLTTALNDARRATEDLRISQDNGILSIASYQREFDKAFADEKKTGVKMTADEMQRLVDGLYNSATNAETLGKKVPLEQVNALQTNSEKARLALSQMNMTDAEKQALLDILDAANEKLTAAESRARNAAAAIGGMAGNASAAAASGPSSAYVPPLEYQQGGIVPRTGLAGVHQGEIIYNPAAVGGGSGFRQALQQGATGPAGPTNITITVPVHLDGRVIATVVANHVAARR